jgi:Flp pilus assembly protein TadG
MWRWSNEEQMSKSMGFLRKSVVKFFGCRRGAAAVEFAFIVPALTIVVITLADVTTIAAGMGEMQTAMRATVQYAMDGGTDMTVAKTQGLNAWNGKPSDGTMTTATSCTCGQFSTSASASCTSICADETYPKEFVTVTASGTLGGSMIKKSETITEAVRIR